MFYPPATQALHSKGKDANVVCALARVCTAIAVRPFLPVYYNTLARLLAFVVCCALGATTSSAQLTQPESLLNPDAEEVPAETTQLNQHAVQPVVKHQERPIKLRRDSAEANTEAIGQSNAEQTEQATVVRQPGVEERPTEHPAAKTVAQATTADAARAAPVTAETAPQTAVGTALSPGNPVDPLSTAELVPVAETKLAGQPTAKITVSDVDRQLESVKASEGLNEEQRVRTVTLLTQSREWLQTISDLENATAAQIAELANVPNRQLQIEQRLAQPTVALQMPDLETVTLDDVQSAARNAQDALKTAQEKRAEHQQRMESFDSLRKQRRQRETELKQQLDAVQAELKASLGDDVAPLFAAAAKTEQQLRRRMLTAQQAALASKIELANALETLGPLQYDLHQRDASEAEKAHEQWANALALRRQIESHRELHRAQQEARDTDPALRDLAIQNAAITARQSDYADLIRDTQQELDDNRKRFADQEVSFKDIEEKVERFGANDTIGILLRSKAHDLMLVRPLRIRSKELAKLVPQAELEFLQIKQDRESMWDIPRLTEHHFARVNSSILQRVTKAQAKQMVRELLESRKKYLGQLESTVRDYENTISELHEELKNVVTVTSEHHVYIRERVLWIKSADPVGLTDIEEARQASITLLDPRAWQSVVEDAGHALASQPWLSGIAFALFAIGLSISDRLKDRIQKIGESKEVQTGFRFYPTLQAVFATLMLSIFLPGVCYFAGWWLEHEQSPNDVTLAIADGLRWTSIIWLALGSLHHVARPHGLGEAHFGWHKNNLHVLRRNLRWLILIGLPIVFVVMVIASHQDGKWQNSLGRLSFMSGMVLMSFFMHRLLNPYRASRGVWANRKVWAYNVRHLLHACGIAMPLCLAVLAAIGYVYSANQLAYRAQLSLWLLLTVVIVQAIVSRYLMIVRRKAAVRHMQRRRMEQAESESNDGEPYVEDELDFHDIGIQLQRLVRGGVATTMLLGASFIWFDMVPALRMLDRVELWHTTQMTMDYVPDGKDGTKAIQRAIKTPITLADGLLSCFCVVATIVATRNLPGLLNITILERLPIDFGTRYALTTVTRYVLALIGGIAAFYMIGITWNSVQWLVAAMTVGLGFGLQEIFANFVSGLIILTERPIRVGDMVTVGGVMGKVTRIQIRATTITDFDRRELVVPNKRFITEDVINWTLSDPITRLVLPIGIAYEADPELARRKLLEAAAKQPLVLADPEPTAIFMGFGDSTLDLELRVFMMGRDKAFDVRDELNRAINAAFRSANIEIAFPQRDLHIRTVDGKSLVQTLGETAHRKAA